jgi:hypothetical protein
MANTQAANGFVEFRRLNGGAPTGGQEGTPFKLAYDYTTAIGYGDPVIQLNTGYLGRGTTGGSVAIKGIFVGCQYIASATSQLTTSRYWPGSGNSGTGDIQAFLITDPDQLYIAQAYNTACAFLTIGANINIQIGTVNTTTGFSGASVDQSTLAATTTLPFRIYGLLSQYQTATGAVDGTDDTSAYNRVIVKANYFDRMSLDGI